MTFSSAKDRASLFWQLALQVLLVVAAAILMKDSHSGICDTYDFSPQSFPSVHYEGGPIAIYHRAKRLQTVLTKVYPELNKGARNFVDGDLGSNTLRAMTAFCSDLNLPAVLAVTAEPTADRVAKNTLKAIFEFEDVVVGIAGDAADWREKLKETEFSTWRNDCLIPGAYLGLYYYDAEKPFDPGLAFLLHHVQKNSQWCPAQNVSREKTAARKTAEPSLVGRFVLLEEDFETLKMESKAFSSLGELVGLSSLGEKNFREQIVATMGLKDIQSTRLLEQIVQHSDQSTVYRLSQIAGNEMAILGASELMLKKIETLQAITFNSRAELETSISNLLDLQSSTLSQQASDAEAQIKAKQDELGDDEPPPTVSLDVVLLDVGVPSTFFRYMKSEGQSVRFNRRAFVRHYTSTLRGMIEEVQAFSVTQATVDQPDVKELAETIPAPIIKKLQKELSGVVFPDGELFRTALRVVIGVDKPNVQSLHPILRVALKQPRPPVQSELKLAPAQWQGSDCGCAAFEALDRHDPAYFYGLFPYWQAPQLATAVEDAKAEEIDFSMFNRIAYYGLKVQGDGSLNKHLPLHFQQKQQPDSGPFWKRQNYVQFINKARQYKTKVDVVLYNADWDEWISVPSQESSADSTSQSSAQKPSKLIDSILDLILPKVESYLNRVKPIVSAGNSPSRTMADGVTLHFDFHRYSRSEQQILFDQVLGESFFKALRASLPESKSKEQVTGTTENESSLAVHRNQYFINLIVPSECITDHASTLDHCTFFSTDNLQKIEGSINLILVDLSSRDINQTVIAEMQKIRASIEHLPVGSQLGLLKKIVPLVAPGQDSLPETNLGEKFRFADWNFTGFGFWQLQADEATKSALFAGFLEPADDNLLAKIELSVCNITCPHRWMLRIATFFLVLLTAILLLVSWWWVQIRSLFSTVWFRLGSVGVAAVFVSSIYCDPFWMQFQSLILFVSLVIAMVYLYAISLIKERAKSYP